MEDLGRLFGSEGKVRMLRLFFLNPNLGFTDLDIARRTQINPATVRKEIKTLKSVGVIKKTRFFAEIKKRKKTFKRMVSGWMLEKNFHHKDALQEFLVNTDIVRADDILRRFNRAGNIKLLIIAGVFIKDEGSRADILIVGDKIKKGVLENIIRTLEAEIGKELSYAAFDTKDFKYRLEIHDRFMRDIFDYPHEVVIDKLKVS